MSAELEIRVKAYQKIQQEVFLQHNLTMKEQQTPFKQYSQYVLWEGSDLEKKELIKGVDQQMLLIDKEIKIDF